MRISLFGKIRVKYTKLSHLIDSKTTNKLDNIDNEFIQFVINEYDAITSECECI